MFPTFILHFALGARPKDGRFQAHRRLLSVSLWSLLILLGSPKAFASWTLAWDASDPNEGIVSYYIYERVDDITYDLVGAMPASPDPSWEILCLPDGVHTFVVTAVNASGESTYSNEVSIEVGSDPKPPPRRRPPRQ